MFRYRLFSSDGDELGRVRDRRSRLARRLRVLHRPAPPLPNHGDRSRREEPASRYHAFFEVEPV